MTDPVSSTVWIGIRFSNGAWRTVGNGRPLSILQADWAPGQPDVSGGRDCAVADRDLGYRWRTAGCFDQHAYYCSMYTPACPDGYVYVSWLSEIPGVLSKSCYKVTNSGAYRGAGDGRMYNSVSLADRMCRRDNARLAVPENGLHTEMLATWLRSQSAWKDPSTMDSVRELTENRIFFIYFEPKFLDRILDRNQADPLRGPHLHPFQQV